jgi:uncharacterized protein (TIGR02118 family)
MRPALRPPSALLLCALAGTACAKPADRTAAGDTTGGASTTTTATAGGEAASGSEAAVVVLYKMPKDTAAFEKYYSETHLPLASANQQEVGFTRIVAQRFPHKIDGSAPTYYREAEVWFPSMAALERGTKTPGFKRIADDLGNFATGGADVLIGQKTGK